MTTRQLDPNDVLADLESFLADNDPTTRGLDLDTQAAITTLLWEVAGIVTIAEQTKQSPNTARGLARLRTIAARLLTILDFSEEAFDLAETQIDALPWSGVKQALLANRVGHYVSERDYLAGVCDD